MSAATDIEFLVDFLNTIDVEAGTDALSNDPEARDIRDALRTAVIQRDVRLPAVALRPVVTATGVELTGDTPASRAVAIAATLTAQGGFDRLKLCHAHDCAWAFYDRSRNGSRTWCSMAVCGNREKARTFRAARPAP
jgi:hypothetical protein